MNELNIYQRLLKITEELNTVKKGLTVGSKDYGYKAVGEMDILQAVRPLEIQYGVYSYPMNRVLVAQEMLSSDKNKTKFMMRVETTYRFVNIDKPSEFVDQVSYGDGIDSLDKSPGKAMTYSDKYSLMKAYKIMTGDDPDQNHSKDTTVHKYDNTPKTNAHAKIQEHQKDKIIKLVQEGHLDLTGILVHYKVKSTDELNFVQANAVITKGNKNKEKA